jgi:molybdate transport system substrate-binding protein
VILSGRKDLSHFSCAAVFSECKAVRVAMKSIRTALFIGTSLWALAVHAAEPVRVFAAGSLKLAFTELAAAFEAKEGTPIRLEFGPSGLLRDRLLKGEAADLFASANMEHPQALHDKGLGAPVKRFTRNSLCALAGPKLVLSSETLLERMLDPAVKLGISTPKSDPSGDYAIELFARAGKRIPGARERLVAKAMMLTGGLTSPPPPKDRTQYGKLVEDGTADVFLTYCTNAMQARKEVPGEQVVTIPNDINVGADYGLTVLVKSDAANRFADFVLSPAGQAILEKQGFSAVSSQ